MKTLNQTDTMYLCSSHAYAEYKISQDADERCNQFILQLKWH